MHHHPSKARFLRKMIFLSILGFLIVMLIGPILAVVGVFFAFGVIGFLAWCLYRGFVLVVSGWRHDPLGEREALRNALRGAGQFGRQACAHGLHAGRRAGPAVAAFGRRAVECAVIPVRVGARLGRGVADVGYRVGQRAAARARFLAIVLAEGLSGALVGGIVGFLVDWQAINEGQHPFLNVYTGGGVLIGGVVGVVLAFLWRERAKEIGAST
jgi:hypothetical protein